MRLNELLDDLKLNMTIYSFSSSEGGVIVTVSVDISASSDISFQILFMVSVKNSTMIESLSVLDV